jgi:NAD-dependent deacetylase
MDADASDLDSLAADVTAAETVVVFTGAGVSTASGIPSFRGEGGVWKTAFDPADFHYGRFSSDPAGFWADRLDLHDALFGDDPEPNAAHEAIAALEAAGVVDAVVTQNTDGLHADAGSERVLELHGNARRVVCQRCGDRADAAAERDRAAAGELPPTCDCGGVLKPDVVLFGEQLPRETLREARALADAADVFLAVGSSLRVEPAASLPRRAADDGVLAVVNLDATEQDALADYCFHADVTEVLPRLEAALGDRP